MIHETTKKFMEGFRYNAHPMAMLVSTVAALSTVYPEARNIHDPANRAAQIKRLIGKVPSIAAMSYRHNLGFPYVYPDNDLSYHRKFHEHAVEDGRAEVRRQSGAGARARYSVHPARRSRAELQHQRHARRGQLARRSVSGDRRRGRGALAGPLHGGANEEVLRMLDEIGIQGQRARLHQEDQGRQRQADGLRPPRLQELRSARARSSSGPPTRCSRSRAEIAKLDIALELERIALEDDYFV